MTSSQKKFYRWILTKNFTALRKESKGSTNVFLNVIMQLRKCCNHSSLFEHPDSKMTHLASAEEQLQVLKQLFSRRYMYFLVFVNDYEFNHGWFAAIDKRLR